MSHTSDKLCYCADAYIVNSGKLLLHLHQKYSMWLAPGGHIDPGENPFEAVLREVKEETGLEIFSKQSIEYIEPDRFFVPVPFAINQHPVGEGRFHVSLAYAFTSKNREITPHPDEYPTEFKWFSIEELFNSTLNIPKNVRMQGGQALQELMTD